jgi:hypothetical protein
MLMVHRVRDRRSNKRHGALPVGWCEAVARRPVLVGVLLTAALLAMGAARSLPSGAASVRTARRATAPTVGVSTPAISPLTVTVPGGETPPVSVPPVTIAPVVTPPVATPPVPSTPTAPASPVASAPTTPAATVRSSASAAPAPTRASLAGDRVSAKRLPARRARHTSDQNRLRGVVVGLSQCLSILRSRSQRLLLLRAGIGTVGSDSRRAVARKLRMTVAREARLEDASLLRLQRAARERRCGVTPVWIHVPVRDRLVLVDPVLTHRS